jgi:spore germination protein YaaH
MMALLGRAARAQSGSTINVPAIAAYHAWWMADEWRAAPWQRLDRLFFFEVRIGADGALADRNGWPDRWRGLIDATQQAGIPLDVTLALFGAADFNALFLDGTRVRRLVDEALALVRSTPSVGLQLDVETAADAAPAAVAAFQRFVRDLRTALDREPRRVALSAFVAMGEKALIFDRDALQALDFLVVQGYDAHWMDSPNAGPVSVLHGGNPIAWERSLEVLARLGADRARMLFSLPFYGYEWQTFGPNPGAATRGPGRQSTFAPVAAHLLPQIRVSALERVRRYGARRDLASGSPYYAFEEDGRWVQGWYEDAASLAQKMSFARSRGVQGFAVFVLGYDGGALIDGVMRAARTLPRVTG